ncbi:protein asteroid homolog 1-like [Gordionus sp. m RMFG-2023]|uniref:protein asteroid homolog 1-like n=1 Tax=Gordionus sp. m RMFG-2023 TaxID=3053472 RepID=UPI0031FD698D
MAISDFVPFVIPMLHSSRLKAGLWQRPNGCSDPYNHKTETRLQRQKVRLQKSLKPLHGNTFILPILCEVIFIEILKELNIPHYQCLFEADKEIAELANYWNCAVLSEDSDFYIYPLTHGYIPLSSISFIKYWYQDILNENLVFYPFKANIFRQKLLLSEYPGLKLELLPLLAAINGNDYSHDDYTSFLENIGFNYKLNDKRYQSRIKCVLLWLSNFKTIDSALENVLSHFELNLKIKSQICTSIEIYHLSNESLVSCFFSHKAITIIKCEYPDVFKYNCLQKFYHMNDNIQYNCTNCHVLNPEFIKLVKERLFDQNDINFGSNSHKVLLYLQNEFHEVNYNYQLLNLLFKRTLHLSTQVENYHDESSYNISQDIRKLVYIIFLGKILQPSTNAKSNLSLSIYEYKRKLGNMFFDDIEVKPYGNFLNSSAPINNQMTLPEDLFTFIIFKSFGIDHDAFNIISQDFKLFLISLKYFHATSCQKYDPTNTSAAPFNLECHTFPSSSHIFITIALILMLLPPLLKSTQCLTRYSKEEIKNFHEQQAKFMSKYKQIHKFTINSQRCKSMDMELIHGIAQWQTCLYALYLLNQISNFAFNSHSTLIPFLAFINSSQIYNLAKQFKNLNYTNKNLLNDDRNVPNPVLGFLRTELFKADNEIYKFFTNLLRCIVI